MAVIREMDQEAWEAWVKERPPEMQDLCRRFPPNRLYRLKESGHRVTVYSYLEDGTMTVIVSGDYNFVAFERRVFGIRPEDLEECDLPGPDEVLGAVYTEEEDVQAYIKSLREQRREQSS